MSNEKKVALVTGASRGIGAAIATAFADSGYIVVTAQRRPPAIGNTTFIETDLSSTSACTTLIETLMARHGRLDALINNAGMMPQSALADTSLELWDQTLAVNLRAPFILTREAIEPLRKTRGSIVNIGSIEGVAANPKHSAYAVSKAGLHALTRATAVDHGEQVRCNAIAPGWIDTELNTEFVQSLSNAESFRHRINALHPIGRTGLPEEVAGLAVFLCSEAAAFICGQTITVDGGRTVRLPLPS